MRASFWHWAKMREKGVKKDKIMKDLRRRLSEDKRIVFAYVHGSFLDGRDFKDIDIAIFLDKETAKNSDSVDMEISLSLELEKAISLPIDVKILNDAPLGFCYHATKGKLILSRDETIREEFLCRTWSAYFDFLPVSKIYLQESMIA
jgi:predicted nucleotidyltransferase